MDTFPTIEHKCKIECLGQGKIYTKYEIGWIEFPNGDIYNPIYFCPYCGEELDL